MVPAALEQVNPPFVVKNASYAVYQSSVTPFPLFKICVYLRNLRLNSASDSRGLSLLANPKNNPLPSHPQTFA
jgi:hypothetical protein